jgi:hypothetical protein
MRSSLFAIALCLASGAAFAQTAGSITGEVKDQSGAVAPDVSVTATNSETNVARSTVTNAAGITVSCARFNSLSHTMFDSRR